jgi:RNA methyltransferase, TrmH family
MPGLSKRQESLVRSLSQRHGRRNSELCLCEGLRCCSEALTLRPDLVELVATREGFAAPLPKVSAETAILPERQFDSLCSTITAQGVFALLRKPEQPDADAPLADPFAFVLDRVSDPGNFGTILRTARAAGLKEVWYAKGSTDPFSEKCIRSASSSQFALALRQFDALPELATHLKSLGVERFFRTTPAGGGPLYAEEKLFERSAIIMGGEAFGAGLLEGAQDISIPMPGGAESLNVAQASTIILFEHVRRNQRPAR